MKPTLFFLILLTFISCKHDKKGGQDNAPVYQFDLSRNDKVSILEICDSIQIIKIPTNDSCLLSSAARLKADNKHFYIQSQNGIYILDRQGNYLHRIYNVGRGPGEYDSIEEFVIDPFNQSILLVTCWTGIHEYDFNGKYLQTFRPEGVIHRIFPFDKDIIVCLRGTNRKKIHYFSRKKEEYISSTFTFPKIIDMVFAYPGFSKEKINYQPITPLNTYYKIEKDRITPIFHFSTGNSPYTLEQIKFPSIYDKIKQGKATAQDQVAQRAWLIKTFPITIMDTRVFGNSIIAQFYDVRKGPENAKIFYVLYNTRDNTYKKFNQFSEKINWKSLNYFNENEIVYLCEYEQREEYIPYQLLDEKSKQIYDNMKENDNQLIVRLKLKSK